MRQAGNSGLARRVTPGRENDATRRSAVRPLSVEAVELSPALVPEQNLLSGRKAMSSGTGGVVPTVVAEPPLVVTFTAVAEVHMSASVNEVNSPSQWATHCLHSTSVEQSLRPLQPEPSEHPTGTPRGVVGASDNQPVSEPTKQSRTGGNLVLKPAPSEIAEQPRSRERLSPKTGTVPRPLPIALPGVVSESQQSEDPTRMDRPENTGSRPESGEAIVVGAIGSAAPWFLTGWAHDLEIEFMIDTGCQVTILSATVFERMCTVNPAVRFTWRPCRRRLVSADSSPLIVQGQLECKAIVFAGLCCKMLFVVANIGSDGLLGTEALQSYLPHQLNMRTGQLWADGWSTLPLHQQRLTHD